MDQMTMLSDFFKSVQDNPCIGPSHVSCYAALLEISRLHGYQMPVLVKRSDVMVIARINGISTYHRLIKDLVKSGCIKYEGRFDRQGSKVYL